jgi:hypothetical protein
VGGSLTTDGRQCFERRREVGFAGRVAAIEMVRDYRTGAAGQTHRTSRPTQGEATDRKKTDDRRRVTFMRWLGCTGRRT